MPCGDIATIQGGGDVSGVDFTRSVLPPVRGAGRLHRGTEL